MSGWSSSGSGRPRGIDPSQARDALTQVLALESRNALSRVELAASELARLDTNPAMRDRLDTIRDAVGELDVLLGKLGLLWSARSGQGIRLLDVDGMVDRVLARLMPTLQARGIEVELDAGAGRVGLGLTPGALERLLFGFLRLVLASFDRDGVLRLETRQAAGGLEVAWRREGTGGSVSTGSADPARRLELELQLAECDGSLMLSGDGQALLFWLPAETAAVDLEAGRLEEERKQEEQQDSGDAA